MMPAAARGPPGDWLSLHLSHIVLQLNSHLASALLGLDMIFFGSLTTQEATGMCICCAGSVPVLVGWHALLGTLVWSLV